MNLSKNIFNNKNKERLFGLLTILISLWTVLYFIPDFLNLLFNTFLGNLILITISILTLLYNLKYGIVLSLIFIIIYRFSHIKEGFTWNEESEKNFLLIQNTINPGIIFDTNTIKNSQASQEEVDYFNKNSVWPWSQKTKDLYVEALNKNPYVRTLSENELNYVMSIYNESAILRLLSHQTKEGQFLLNGILIVDTSGNKMEELPSGFGDFVYNSELMQDRRDDIIKCNTIDNNNATLERIKYTGKGGIFGEQKTSVTPVDYNDLEEIIPGFTFLNGPCNPCGVLNENPDYSCPFKLTVKNKPPFISSVWQYLWNINDNPLQSTPSFLSENINPDEFPILSELQGELKKKKEK
jgi:hypothetical protein